MINVKLVHIHKFNKSKNLAPCYRMDHKQPFKYRNPQPHSDGDPLTTVCAQYPHRKSNKKKSVSQSKVLVIEIVHMLLQGNRCACVCVSSEMNGERWPAFITRLAGNTLWPGVRFGLARHHVQYTKTGQFPLPSVNRPQHPQPDSLWRTLQPLRSSLPIHLTNSALPSCL